MKEAIQRAIEGGWRKGIKVIRFEPKYIFCENDMIYYSEILLDPLFWQALGKAEGWGPNKECNRCGIHISGWKAHWHRFIDFIAEGGTPDAFFNQLLRDKEINK